MAEISRKSKQNHSTAGALAGATAEPPTLQALASALKLLDDRQLRALVAKCAVAELMLAIRLLPLERSNRILAAAATGELRTAVEAAIAELIAGQTQPGDAGTQSTLMQQVIGVSRERRSVIMLALDGMASMLGTLRRERST